MVQKREVTVRPDTGEIVEQTVDTQLTSVSIENISKQMMLAEQLVDKLFRPGIDFGTLPGTQGPGLWDAGAAKIIRAYGCHAEHKILFKEDNEDLVSWTIEAQLINRAGEIVGSGLGAASTRETKYRYRWVKKDDATREGYAPEQLEELKTRTVDGGQTVLFRIENPEFRELVHTLLTMAAKRSECDAAKSLPGVASALRAKFDAKPGKQAPDRNLTDGQQGGQEDLTLPIFWSMAKGFGLTEDEIHQTLKVKSMKDWKDVGKTYRDAIIYIGKVAVTSARGQRVKNAPQSGTPPAPKAKIFASAKDVIQTDVNSVDDLIRITGEIWKMGEVELFNELGYSDRAGFEEAAVQTPWEAFQELKNIRA